MNPMLNIAIRAARKAGNIIAKGYELAPQDTQVSNKGTNDYVTSVDKAAEEAIIEVIRKSYPEHAIVGEESGVIAGENNDIQWVIDPLDGTTNFVKRFPHFSVSIAIRVNGRTEVGVVYDPIRNELFTAVRGEGAKLNEFRLRIDNERRDLNGSVLATGFPFKVAKHRNAHLNMIEALMNNGVADFRRTGSAALDLAYVASGRIDGYFEIGLKPWDSAAGDLIAREAGALVTNFVGGTDYLKSGNIVAGNGRVVKEILNSIQPTLTDELKA
ncbi:inositol-1-monophosphatase [Ursidibacter maritimus]|uniref:Inositol-1-monophosphatase n=1 Tax=Ursidibacter maritimus TaxID=1331689 RepID=A0A949WH79_9PAST|nr:inositol-1-monophosphatase [Ursidibacter maritimus]KAE9540531.1 inositol monophosphatase [Ursidibacter maritimus]MBV6524040.1 inositol-1-monophosphatase [Ursidibacter maritimus]MBV6525123.1 inositol-1-monophosphatase [Ursidibacter maritimus]MBV6527325.1 inositol-1-monophosphatase [Ursidibacter maritimus]MBV6528737.1 inositol-1-monophosphatase [Ursidibacter maritimus]